MAGLHQQICLNHHAREAVARCPECGQFFCRECISEHDGRVICAACLKKMFRLVEPPRRPALRRLARALAFGFSLMTGWVAFYVVAKILLRIPTSFHDGTIWQNDFMQE